MTARPEWLERVVRVAAEDPPEYFRTYAPPPGEEHRRSAVLLLFGELDDDPGADVVLTRRAEGLRHHPGQVSFPGGRVDPTDAGPVEAALREAREEVGLDPSTVDVLGALPDLFLRPSGNVVTPVIAWWREPHEIGVVDEREVASVLRASVAELLDPENRFTVTHPLGFDAPGFEVGGLFVWGFTALLLTHTFDLAGLTRPWDAARTRPIPHDVRPSLTAAIAARLRGRL